MNSDNINDAQQLKRKRSGGGRAFHSRLESLTDFIREQRQRRRTWKEIAAVLTADKGCAITAQGVHQFYRRYLRRRARPHWEDAVTPVAEGQPETPTMPLRKPILAAIPQPHNVRRPNLEDLTLNDPTKI